MKTVKEEVDDIINAPNFTTQHCGTTYKFGSHGFVYRWSNTSDCWIKSEVESEVLCRPIKLRIIKERNDLATRIINEATN